MKPKDNKQAETAVESEPEVKQQERLPDEDRHLLELAVLNKKLALSQAEKALAENNAADQAYKYLVLQLYMKHGMNVTDGFDEHGNIHRNVKGK